MGHLDDLVDLAQCKWLQTAAAKSTTVLNDTKAGFHKQIPMTCLRMTQRQLSLS